jgi:starch phosphorylase
MVGVSILSRPAIAPQGRSLADQVRHHIRYTLGRPGQPCSPYDLFRALAWPLRERLIDGLAATERRYDLHQARRVHYLSAEFLVGQSLRHNLLNLGLLDAAREACAELGADLDSLLAAEPDAALGNGGLGRLAACFLESMASLHVPGFGYGINYEFGSFHQEIQDGEQVERPDIWRPHENPWLIERADEACLVPINGTVEHGRDRHGRYNPMWLDWQVIVGVPSDVPIVGAGGRTVNALRLYAARASDEFDMRIFNAGDYIRAVERKIASETLSKVLYPSDTIASGKELRLAQEYFLVACALRDIVRRFEATGRPIDQLAEAAAIQLNDTHPALAVAELMRILVDEHAVDWDRAWAVTQAACGYTNHTLLPEALEKWPVPLFERLLPRHLQIIFEINHRFLEAVRVAFPGDEDRVRRLSMIEETPERQIRMAHLAVAGSHRVNGVSRLHTDLLAGTVLPDFHQLWPERFTSITNGVNHRRWLGAANPELAALVTECIGPAWIDEPDRLRDLAACAGDAAVQERFAAIRRAHKDRLARLVRATTGVRLDPDSLFDVHIKRIHEYKRQLLNVMHVVYRYLRLVEDGVAPEQPRSVIFSGKAAPGYAMAKLVIRLVHHVAAVVNADARAAPALQVAFVPDYRVSLAEQIVPAADLSEQISTAGMEASGTGNMKLAMNGAVTIGTLDGANVEIREEVGDDNIYIFGLRAEEVRSLRESGAYQPAEYCQRSEAVRRVLDALCGNRFCPGEPGLFRPLHDAILYGGDRYMHVADLEAYIAAQDRVAADALDVRHWRRKALLNVAGAGRFSSDRTIREYAARVWHVAPVPPDAAAPA